MTDEPDEVDEARWEQAAALLDEADELLLDGRIDAARSLAREAADALHEILGDEHPDFANALRLLGEVALALGKPGEAVERFTSALAIYDRYMDEHAELVGPMRIPVLGLLARTHADHGRYAEGEALIREAMRSAEQLGDALGLAIQTQGLGVLLRFAGRYDEAAAAYELAGQRTLAAGRQLGPEHFHNLAGLALARGDAEASEAYAREAVSLRAEQDFGLATDLCGLADAIAEQGRHAEAEPIYRRALAIFTSGDRREHPEVGYALHNLADALAAMGRADEAEAAYRESLARKLEVFGPGTPDEAGTRNNLAALLAEHGRLDEALAESKRACELVQALAPDHPIRIGCEALAIRLRGA